MVARVAPRRCVADNRRHAGGGPADRGAETGARKLREKLRRLSDSHGGIRPRRGLASGVVARLLAVLCFPGMQAFHFPEYLTTPQLHRSYDAALMRQLLYWSLVLAGVIARFNVVFARVRWRRPRGRSGLSRRHTVRRAGPVHPRPARLDAALRLRRAPLVRPSGEGRRAGLGARPAVGGGAVPRRAPRRSRAVLDAPRVPRGAGAVAAARGAPQREARGLAGRLAPAHPGADDHAHAGARADLRARLRQGGDRRACRHRHRGERRARGAGPLRRARRPRAAGLQAPAPVPVHLEGWLGRANAKEVHAC